MTVAQVQIYGAVGGEMTCNVLHFRQDDAVESDLVVLSQRVRDWWCINPCSLHAYAYQTYNRVKVIPYDETWSPVELTFSVTSSWGSSNDWTPMICAVLQLRTASGGRHGRGRHFLGGWDPFQRTNGRWEASIQIKLNAVAQAIEDFWTNASLPSYKGDGWLLGVCPRYQPVDFKFVTEVVGRTTLGVQRRRQLEVGA